MTYDTKARARELVRDHIGACGISTCPDDELGTEVCCRRNQVAAIAAALDEARIAGMREARAIWLREHRDNFRAAIDVAISELTDPPAEPSP